MRHTLTVAVCWSQEPYCAPWACSTLVAARQLLETWLEPWPFPTETDPYGYEVTACCGDRPDHSWATISREGSAWTEVVRTWEFRERWKAVAHDTVTAEELFNVTLPDGDGATCGEYDGIHAVLSHWARSASPQQDEPILLVDIDGTIAELDIEGRATIWPEPYVQTRDRLEQTIPNKPNF